MLDNYCVQSLQELLICVCCEDSPLIWNARKYSQIMYVINNEVWHE